MSDRRQRRGVLLTVAYEGTSYAGMAYQPNGPQTVASVLLEALRHMDGAIGALRVASRTDTGVHASDQRVVFDTDLLIPTRAWVLGPAPHLPPTVAIHRAAYVSAGYQPRFQTTTKTYRYLLLPSPVRDPMLAGRVWRLDGLTAQADLDRMSAELVAAHGTHCFAAFRSARDGRDNTVRTLTATAVRQVSRRPNVVAVDITGDGFLHRMVRILVGTVVDVARGRLPPGAVRRALASGRRTDAGITAPPHGLHLKRVGLRDEGRDPWPPDPTGDQRDQAPD